MAKENKIEPAKISSFFQKIRSFYFFESGGKKAIHFKRLAVTFSCVFFILVLAMAFISPDNDKTFYKRTTYANKDAAAQTDPKTLSDTKTDKSMNDLFESGKQKQLEERSKELAAQKHKISIKYFAPQVLNGSASVQKAIRAGAKLLGFLLNNIDTRDPSMVRVVLPKGGESMGIEIPQGSVVTGQFTYGGNGNKVFVSFHRLDTPDGKIRRIQASALDSKDYSTGIRGDLYSENGVKIASQMGLSMFAGMADTLTEKESVGMGTNSVQAKLTMKNALLQGVSRATQDEANRTSSEIQEMKDYVVISEGKEIIVQLLEDYSQK